MELFKLESFIDKRGSLTALNFHSISFEIKRFYWIILESNEPRGFHAHKKLNQILFVIKGTTQLKLDDGTSSTIFTLCENDAIHIQPGVWREFISLDSQSIVGCLASEIFNEDDYIRNYSEFMEWKNEIL